MLGAACLSPIEVDIQQNYETAKDTFQRQEELAEKFNTLCSKMVQHIQSGSKEFTENIGILRGFFKSRDEITQAFSLLNQNFRRCKQHNCTISESLPLAQEFKAHFESLDSSSLNDEIDETMRELWSMFLREHCCRIVFNDPKDLDGKRATEADFINLIWGRKVFNEEMAQGDVPQKFAEFRKKLAELEGG